MKMTDEMTDVEQDALVLGFELQEDGTYTWPRYPLWQIEAMACEAYRASLPQRIPTCYWEEGKHDIWVATHAEAITPRDAIGRASNAHGETGPLRVSRHVGGDRFQGWPKITDVIAYVESVWDEQRQAVIAPRQH